jgi:AcrR family transcriptional regulator
MRSRTEERRRAIIRAAAEVFVQQGVEGASMSAIAERLGGSKATLYSYFSSKEDLFRAVMQADAAAEAELAGRALEQAPTLREGLARFGAWRLRHTLNPAGLAARQMAYSQAGREAVTGLFGIADPSSSTWGRLAAQLEAAMNRGELRRADPWTAAQHFRGLLEADITDRAFFAFPTRTTATLQAKAVEDAVDVFLRAYRPD